MDHPDIFPVPTIQLTSPPDASFGGGRRAATVPTMDINLAAKHASDDGLSPSPKRSRTSPRLHTTNGIDHCAVVPLTRAPDVGAEGLNSPQACRMDWEPADSESVCFGALCDTQAIIEDKISFASLTPSPVEKFHVLDVADSGRSFSGRYCISGDTDGIIAYLDSVTCVALRTLEKVSGIVKKAIIESTSMERCMSKRKTKRIVTLSINIYGSPGDADQIGSMLSDKKVFLQHPFYIEPGCEYRNPQLFRPGGQIQNLIDLVGLPERDLRAKTLSNELERLFETLDNALAGDLTITERPDGIINELTSHQTLAVRFILQREEQTDCQKSHSDLQHLLGMQYPVPTLPTGGIVADAMGLGKTLTMLSAIRLTSNRALSLSSRPLIDESVCQSAATLVVVTSLQVLNVWEAEVQKHFEPGALRYNRFHGNERTSLPHSWETCDIVLTTYGTLTSDYKTRGVLRNTHWFRVVLDEAHLIRNRNSKQFKAAKALSSHHRWCLTGTPIQNRLDDLVALLQFLRFEPFCQPSQFQQHISDPLRKDIPYTFPLRCLLQTICLRRSAKLLKLPESRTEEVTVILDSDERELYTAILDRCNHEIDKAVSSLDKDIKKSRYVILFAAISNLRRLCNHGTTQVGDEHLLGGGTLAVKSDFDCDLCNGEDQDRLHLIDNVEFCPRCGESLAPGPINVLNWKGSGRAQSIAPGPSTKVRAVVGRILSSEPGSKSIVFSAWTTTLSMLAQQLELCGVKFRRIDGRTSYQERISILEVFKTTDIPVLLMSIGTGAVGLTLTVANYVHIVEPQWNPSVEEQAIARAVRMGQTRNVTVVRYVVKSSVEENIASMQRRKRNLAKFTLDASTDSASAGSLDDLKFVLHHRP